MPATIPIIEIADDTDPLSVRRPGSKQHAIDAFKLLAVGTQNTVHVPVPSLLKQVEIKIRDLRRKTVWIVKLDAVAVIIDTQQLLMIGDRFIRALPLEKIRIAKPPHYRFAFAYGD